MTKSAVPRTRAIASPAWRALAADGALLASAVVGGAALCRMVAGGLGGAASGPVLVTAAAGCVLPGVLLWRQVRGPVAAAVGALTVALFAMWSTVPDATRDGVPTATTLRVLRADLRASRADLSTFRLPLHASPGIVVLGALLAGMAAVAARMTFGAPATRPPRLPAAALVPSAALVTWSTVADPGTGSAILAAALIGTGSAVVTLAAAAAAPAAGAEQGLPGRSRVRRHRLGSGMVVSVVARTVAVAVGATTGAQSGATTGSGGSGGSTTGGAVPPTGLALASDLLGLERKDPSVVLFWARSPVPTYWQVGVLTQWQEGRWLPDQATTDALNGASVVGGAVRGLPTSSNRTFDATVTVGHLSSRLLPVPPATTTVDVPGGGTVTQAGALASRASTLDERYRATAIVPPALSTAATSSAPGLSAAQLAPDLALPAVSPVVTALAHQVTSVATSPLGRAEALVDWFRSGAFRYTLTPPTLSPGSDPLVVFLTTARAGTCEAFAGAFAVMARSLGLPTRVAVGFTGGRTVPGGTTTVRGADAHEWPEVYLGAASGWVSFEPTPQLPSGELSPPSVVGPTGVQLPTTIPPSGGSVPVTVPPAPSTSTSSAVSTPLGTGLGFGVPRIAPVSAGVGTWVLVTGGVLVVLAMVVLMAERRRRLRLRSATNPERALWAYGRAERGLARAGMARPAWRSPPAHARSLLTQAQRAQEAWDRDSWSSASGDELQAALRDVLGLAELLESASYGATTLTRDEIVRAEHTVRRVRRTLRRRSVRALATEVVAGGVGPESARRA